VRQLDPAADVRIDRQAQRVEVTSTQDPTAIAQAIREEGYTVS
jgi:copper chaperone CopZ